MAVSAAVLAKPAAPAAPAAPLAALIAPQPLIGSPKRHNIPAFLYRPEHGSDNVKPFDHAVDSVSATCLAGGYPDVNGALYEPLTTSRQINVLCLITLIWSSNEKDIVESILGKELACKISPQLNTLLGRRVSALPTNPAYHMVQEQVEIYDLGVHVRNLARVVVRARLAIPDETADQLARRQELANECEAASFELRDRAIARLDKAIADPTFRGTPGHAQAMRLKKIRIKIHAKPPDVTTQVNVIAST